MAKPTHKTEGYIYFLFAPEVGRIKIGFTTNFKQRLADLKNTSPCELELLKIVRGNFQTELALHAVFHGSRQMGEWYEVTQKLVDFIAGLENGKNLKSEDLLK